MYWNLALVAFFIVFVGSAILSMVNTKIKTEFRKPIESFVLANGTLKRQSVISLLLSTSFGLNYLFYQIWAGYTVGIWALIPQAFWVLGLVLIGRYSSIVKNHNSLHELLGIKFDKRTRMIASICSIIGILFMMGWETGIGTASFNGIFKNSHEEIATHALASSNLLIAFIVFGSLFYTIVGGLKGNANVDLLLNTLKIVIVGLAAYLLYLKFSSSYPTLTFSAIFPTVQTMRNNFGLWGMITSILFSVVWQFVDNSTWQTLRAGNHEDEQKIKTNLFITGIAAFIAPGIIGTVIGISLISPKPMIQEDMFSLIISLTPAIQTIVIFCVFAVLIACIMSLIDGLFLVTAFTLIIDFLHPDKKLSDIDVQEKTSENTLIQIRVVLILVALAGLYGTQYIYKLFNLTIFDCFYLMMIPQLTLIGPVVFSLNAKRNSAFNGSVALSIIIVLLISYALFFFGAHVDKYSWIKDATGSIEIFLSILTMCIFTKKTPQSLT